MAKEILYNGVKYPLELNMLVFAKWEEHTGLAFSEIGSLMANTGSFASAIKALALLYFAIQDACSVKEIEFDYTLDNFIRGIDISDQNKLAEMFSLINPTEGIKTENKRRPNKIKQQLKKLA